MTHRIHGALIASLGAVALMLAADAALARSGPAAHGGFTPARSMFHRSIAQSLRYHRRNNGIAGWPGVGGDYYGYGAWGGDAYGPSNEEPVVDGAPPASGDIHQTYTYDVPWDWAHRFPPAVTSSGHPYVPSCPTETVTVPGYGGRAQTVNVIRCY